MEADVVDGVGSLVETAQPAQLHGSHPMSVRMLGPLTLHRGDASLALPASRKVRALFAYLALAPHPVPRSQLCELLWDVPNDPRGELRWCLSKIRGLIDEPDRRRVETRADTVGLDLTDCFVDAIEIGQAVQGIKLVTADRLQALASHFAGDFLDGLEIERSPSFGGWLTAQRRRFRGCHTALLEQLVRTGPEDVVSPHLEKWLELAPFDQGVHELMFSRLARLGQMREAEEHLAVTCRLFESEGLDCAPLQQAWRSARAQPDGSARVRPSPPQIASQDGIVPVPSRRASIAVMPLLDRTIVFDGSTGGGAADALAHDVITRLAKLRSLVVIAQGTVFALHERRIGPEAAGRMLNVDYVVSGSLRHQGKRLIVTVELAETRTARIVWTETFDQKPDDALLVLDEIGNRIVAAIASEIEMNEVNRAVLRPPNSLDAWEAHHRGLWHMYRFTKSDNERARHFFEMAVRLDRTFARAHAGLSFTHFQNAFQGWGKRGPEVDLAFAAAGESLMADDRDPAAHWAVGRALWLRGRLDQAIIELEQAIDLSPNFALGHYALGFVYSQAGDPRAAIESADRSRRLSPFDPLLFGMLGSRAMALVRMGQFEAAAEWGIKAAARPNAHAHILAIAAFALALAGRLDEAHGHLAAIHKTLPGYSADHFLTAMQFGDEGERSFREAAKRLGLQ